MPDKVTKTEGDQNLLIHYNSGRGDNILLKEWAGNSGIIVVNKPKGMSSRTAVDHVQAWFAEKIPTGHAGTLDPLATGVLVICLGWTTRQAALRPVRTKWVVPVAGGIGSVEVSRTKAAERSGPSEVGRAKWVH